MQVSVAASQQAKRPFRILMIAPTSFFSDYGGHIRILEETRAMQAMGHEVTIVTYYKGSDMPGLDIRRTAPLPWRADYEVGSSRHKLAFDLYLAVTALVEGMRIKPDVIHGHMHEGALIGGILARLLRVPLVFDFQGSLTGEMVDHHFLDKNGLVYPWVYRLERFISRRLPHAILASSERACELLKEQFDVPAHRIHALPDCANLHRFDINKFDEADRLQLRRKLGIPADRLIVAYLGLMTDYQGTHHLIEAAAHLKQAGETKLHFLIMGYPNVAHYRQLAHELGVSHLVTFTGKVEYRDAPYYLSLGQIAVAPKMSLTEGSGKLLNYMSLKQPVVAYDTPVHREYLVEHGVYAPVGDVVGFASCIARLAQDEQLRQTLGQKLYQRAAAEYSWQKACKYIVDLYHYLTKAPVSSII